MSSTTKRNHYLAQALQKNFLAKNESRLWWYSRLENVYDPRTPRGIGHARNIYTVSSAPIGQRDALEKAFSGLEDKAIPALRELERGAAINSDQRWSIAGLVAFQLFRTPSKLELVRKVLSKGKLDQAKFMASELLKLSPEEYETLRSKVGDESMPSMNAIQDLAFTREEFVEIPKEEQLQEMINLGNDLAREYYQHRWTIAHATGSKAFITADECATLVPTAETTGPFYGPKSSGVGIVMPISRNAVLIIFDKLGGDVYHTNATSKQVDDINLNVATNSSQIYSHSRQLIESLVKKGKLAGTATNLDISGERITSYALDELREASQCKSIHERIAEFDPRA